MRTVWLGRVTALEYLARDRAELAEGRGAALAGTLTDTTVSVGVGFRRTEAIDRRAAARGWPVLRRSSGGAALLHRPGDLLWSVVLPRADPRVGRDFVRAYGRLGAPLVAALAARGIPAAWSPALGLSDTLCLFGPRGELLTVGGRALGGAAQHLGALALLHHGSVGFAVDRAALAELFDLDPGLLDRRLTAVGELAEGVSAEAIGRALLERWASAGPGPAR